MLPRVVRSVVGIEELTDARESVSDAEARLLAEYLHDMIADQAAASSGEPTAVSLPRPSGDTTSGNEEP